MLTTVYVHDPETPLTWRVYGSHTIHILSASTEAEANEFAERLRRSGFEVRIECVVDLSPEIKTLPIATTIDHAKQPETNIPDPGPAPCA